MWLHWRLDSSFSFFNLCTKMSEEQPNRKSKWLPHVFPPPLSWRPCFTNANVWFGSCHSVNEITFPGKGKGLDREALLSSACKYVWSGCVNERASEQHTSLPSVGGAIPHSVLRNCRWKRFFCVNGCDNCCLRSRVSCCGSCRSFYFARLDCVPASAVTPKRPVCCGCIRDATLTARANNS